MSDMPAAGQVFYAGQTARAKRGLVTGAGLQQPIVQRRNDEALTKASQSTVEEVVGQVPINGTGEVQFPTWFPITFIEQPAVYGGGSLLSTLIPGTFPTWSVGAANWKTVVQADATYWVGVTLIFVVTGVESQQTVANWTVRGRALKNPVF